MGFSSSAPFGVRSVKSETGMKCVFQSAGVAEILNAAFELVEPDRGAREAIGGLRVEHQKAIDALDAGVLVRTAGHGTQRADLFLAHPAEAYLPCHPNTVGRPVRVLAAICRRLPGLANPASQRAGPGGAHLAAF